MVESFQPGKSWHSERLVAALAASQHGVFSRAQALEAGFTDKMIWSRLEAGLWARPHAGVYRIASVPASWRSRVMAASLACSPPALGSHRTAAAMWALDGSREGVIDVTTTTSGRRRLSGATVHWTRSLATADRGEVDGIPVTRPARTLIDLAAVLDEDGLEEALDSALRNKLVTVPYLERRIVLLGVKGRAGLVTLRDLVADRRGAKPAGSQAENRLRRALIDAGLPRPVRQYRLYDHLGLAAIFDLAYPEVRIGIEFDSYRHHSGAQAWRHDQTRHNRATAQGWLLFHLTAGADVAPVVLAYRDRCAA